MAFKLRKWQEEAVKKSLNWFEKNSNTFDYFVYLQPTSPFRKTIHIDESIKQLCSQTIASSIVSVRKVKDHPNWMKIIGEKGYLKNIPVYLDGAHNVAGSKQLVKYFRNNPVDRWLVIGMLNNKDLKNYLLTVKKIISGVIAIRIPGENNSFSTNQIAKICNKLNIKCIQKKNIGEINNHLVNVLKPKEIIISGSLYLVGKIRSLYI